MWGRARRVELAYVQSFGGATYQWHGLVEQGRDGQIEVGFVHKGLDDFMEQTQRVFNRLVVALIVVGGLIGSSLIGVFATGGPHLPGVNPISVVGFILSTRLGLCLVRGLVRPGRPPLAVAVSRPAAPCRAAPSPLPPRLPLCSGRRRPRPEPPSDPGGCVRAVACPIPRSHRARPRG